MSLMEVYYLYCGGAALTAGILATALIMDEGREFNEQEDMQKMW